MSHKYTTPDGRQARRKPGHGLLHSDLRSAPRTVAESQSETEARLVRERAVGVHAASYGVRHGLSHDEIRELLAMLGVIQDGTKDRK